MSEQKNNNGKEANCKEAPKNVTNKKGGKVSSKLVLKVSLKLQIKINLSICSNRVNYGLMSYLNFIYF